MISSKSHMVRIYKPAEDSWLLLRHVKKRVTRSVLDIGTGSGIQAEGASLKSGVSRVVAVDIDVGSIAEARKRMMEAGVSDKVDLILGDLFRGITGRFDWIVFNPPYLPSDVEADEVSWSGGQRGSELIEKFLSEADGYLKRGGSILLVFSTLTELSLKLIEKRYHVEVLEELPLFFERLFCVLLRPISPF